jgi:hypothetical protein
MLAQGFTAQIVMFILASASLLAVPVRAEEKEAIDLLPGNSLEKHWVTKGSWTIDKEGVVTLTPREGEKGWSRWDAYLWLGDKQYKDFEFDFEYKVQKGGNSGFYFHVGDKNNPVVTGIEVQIYDSGSKGADAKLTDHDSGGIIPGVPPAKNTAKPAGDWNHFNIRCQDDKITVTLNGTVVNELALSHEKIKSRPATGFIGFQDHALPLTLRKLRIREL